MRLQLALNVENLDAAIDYYSKLFDAAPHKRRPGYANFAIEQPPLKLVLFEDAQAQQRLNHLGVEVFTADDVAVSARRMADAGILDEVQHDETCCHATQDKAWSTEPQGIRWEWYYITDDLPKEGNKMQASGCCAEIDEDATVRSG